MAGHCRDRRGLGLLLGDPVDEASGDAVRFEVVGPAEVADGKTGPRLTFGFKEHGGGFASSDAWACDCVAPASSPQLEEGGEDQAGTVMPIG